MNKFKFGDKVWHDKTNLAVVHSLDDELNGIYKIMYQDSPEWIYASANKLTPASDWVKCSERLPEIDVPVLVHTGNGMDIDHTYDFGDGVSFYDDLYGEFTHWMPLPAPPQD